jgi:hypothetical protein
VVAPENYYDAASSLVDRARVVQMELVFDVFKHKGKVCVPCRPLQENDKNYCRVYGIGESTS